MGGACRLKPGFRLPPLITLAAFLEQGHFGRHTRRMRALYLERRTALVTALREQLGSSLSIDLQAGGMHLLARFVAREHDLEVVQRLNQQGIRPSALSKCGVEKPYHSGLLFGFTNIDPSQAVQVVKRLADLLHQDT
jgi:GntR family transcriptional regulator / MocR family aminotransferase